MMSRWRKEASGTMDANDANDGIGDHDHDEEFRAWLDAEEGADPALGSEVRDSDYDSDEARDGVGELPVHFDDTMAVYFVVDKSKSMSYCDVRGTDKCRIDVVIDVIKQFIIQQRSGGATLDRYTFVTFGQYGDYTHNYQIIFAGERAEVAIETLERTSVTAQYASNYTSAFRAIGELAQRGQRTRVVMLADANPNPSSDDLHCLQKVIADNPMLDVHSIGIGDGDFSILQQIAQIGRGTFSRAATDIDKLVNTFTAVSVTLTQTRSTDHVSERLTRTVRFEHARRGGQLGDPGAFHKSEYHSATRWKHFLTNSGLQSGRGKQIEYAIRKQPVMQGGMRILYKFLDLEMPWLPMLAKFSKYESDDNSWDYVRSFVLNTVQTRVYGNRFHQAVWAALGTPWEPRRLVSVAQCFTYQSSNDWFVAEPFLQGSQQGFFKWINNRGEILIPKGSCQYAPAAETFAHFTLDASHGAHMVSDIQGVMRNMGSLSLTDPQVISRDQAFGAADLGEASMQRFRSLHVCNNLCRKLGLSCLHAIPQVPRTQVAPAARRNKDAVRKGRPEVIPCTDSIGRVRRGRSPRAIDQIVEGEILREEMITAEDLLFTVGTNVRKLLFVGEYTHSFSAAAAKIVDAKFGIEEATQVGLDWWSTALNWPRSARIMKDLLLCKESLEGHGVTVVQGVDATDIHLEIEGLHGAIWVMAFPQNRVDRTSSSGIRAHMQAQVEGFVKSVASRLETRFGRVSVVFLAMQHLAWKLPTEITTDDGCFLREVYWLELEPFLRSGYRPRFGDSRDASRDATYHQRDLVVIAQWRRKCGPHDLPGGMVDQRVRSVSASRRSRSASRNCSPNRR